MPEWLEKEIGGVPTWGWLLVGSGMIVAFVVWRRRAGGGAPDPEATEGGYDEATARWAAGTIGGADGVDAASDALYGAADQLALSQEQIIELLENQNDLLTRNRLASKQKPKNQNNPKLRVKRQKRQLKRTNRLLKALRVGGVTRKEKPSVRMLRGERRRLRKALKVKKKQAA